MAFIIMYVIHLENWSISYSMNKQLRMIPTHLILSLGSRQLWLPKNALTLVDRDNTE